MTPIISEDLLQSRIWQKAWNEFPQSRRCMWAVPNGYKLSAPQAMKARATGLLSGVWDLHLFWKGQLYLFELKVGRNNLTDNQKEWGETMIQQGATCYVVRTVDEFFDIFTRIILT